MSKKVLIIVIIALLLSVAFYIWKGSGHKELSDEEARERLNADDQVIVFGEGGFDKENITTYRFGGIQIKNDTEQTINITLSTDDKEVSRYEIESGKDRSIPKLVIFERDYLITETSSGAKVNLKVEL